MKDPRVRGERDGSNNAGSTLRVGVIGLKGLLQACGFANKSRSTEGFGVVWASWICLAVGFGVGKQSVQMVTPVKLSTFVVDRGLVKPRVPKISR